MDLTLIEELMKGPDSNKGATVNGRKYLNYEVEYVTTTRSKFSDLVGAFQGNVGSPRRSRKGRTYHAPNGRRFYVRDSEEVLAYRA